MHIKNGWFLGKLASCLEKYEVGSLPYNFYIKLFLLVLGLFLFQFQIMIMKT